MIPTMGLASSFGWVRAPEHDILNGQAWELPNGQFRFVPKGHSFCVVRDHEGVVSIKLMTTKADKPK